MIKFKKKYLLILVTTLSLSLGVVYFWKNGACLLLDLYLKKFCHDKLQGYFHAKKISNENDYWIIDAPEINGHRPLAEGGMHFEAEKIILTFNPHLSKRQIDLSINVFKPNLNIKQTAADVQAIVNELFPSTSYITVNTKITVSEGALHFHDFKQDPPNKQTIYFQIEGESKDNHKGQITLSLDDPLFNNNCVILSLNQLENQLLTLDFDFDNVSCSTLINAAGNFIPFLSYININQGIVSGQMTLTVPENGRPFAVGDLALHDIQFNSPELEVLGSIKEAYLHLNENTENHESLPATKGFLELAKETTLEFQKEGKPYCKITDLLGGIYFEKPESAFIKIAGKCTHHGTVSQLQLSGNARYGKDQPGINLDLTAQLSSPSNPFAKAKFTTRSLQKELNYAEITLEHIGPSDFDLLKMLFIPYIPQLHETHMNKGFIDASALAYLDGFQMTEMKIEKITAQGVHFSLFPWNLLFKIGNLAGNLSINFKAANILDTLNAELDIADSHLYIFDENTDIFKLTDLQTRMVIHNGNIEKSIVKGTFAGLKGSINFEGPSTSAIDLARFNFRGLSSELADLIPDPITAQIKQHFSSDVLTISGGIQKKSNGVTVEGTLNIKSDKERNGQTIEYGFALEKAPRSTSSDPSGWSVPDSLLAEFPKTSKEDSSEEPNDSALAWLQNQLTANGITLKDGWFQAQNLPLNKYVGPFLFDKNQAKMSGFGDFQISFNLNQAVVNFDLRQAVIENDHLNIDVKNLNANLEKDPTLPLPGTYYIDFDKRTFVGVFPVSNGSYFEKKNGLLFTDIHSLIVLKNKQIHLTRLSTSCTGIGFDGKVEVDLSSPIKEVFSLNVTIDQVHGQFSQLQHLASHFKNLTFLQKLPLEGELHLHKKPATLSIDFIPDDYIIKSRVEGQLTNGIVTFPNADLKINSLETNFEFDHDEETLNLNNIHGKVTIGNNELAQEYTLGGDHILFTNFRKKESSFDLWIGDNTRDTFRIAGKTEAKLLLDENILLEFKFNPNLTHFGEVRPKNFELSLNERNEIASFNLEMGLKVETVLFDLQLAHLAGLIRMPTQLLSEMHHIKTASGGLNIRFSCKDFLWTGHFDGTELTLGTHHYNKFSLHGKKNGSVWALDQLLLDDLSIAADLQKNPEGWTANFLGIRFGESLLVGLEGEFKEQSTNFKGRVNLLEFNIDKLNEWPKLREFVTDNIPKGFLKGTGSIEAYSQPETSAGWQIDLSLNSTIKSLQFRGMQFEDASNVAVRYVSDRSLAFTQLSTKIKDPETKKNLGDLYLAKIEYDLHKNELAIEQLKFNIPPQELPVVTQQLQSAFDDVFSPQIAHIVNHLKHDAPLEGQFDLVKSPAATQMQIALNDGVYHFSGTDHETAHLVLKYNLNSIKLLTQYRLNDHLCWLSLQTTSTNMSSGLMTLSDYYPDIHHKNHPALHINWNYNEQDGILIDSAQGLFSGLMFNLTQDKEFLSNSETLYLQGSVSIDPNQASKLVSNDFSMKVAALELGQRFELHGKWSLEKHDYHQPGLPLHFHGGLQAQNIMIKGYEFQSLRALVTIHHQDIQIHQLKVEDPAVIVNMDHGHFFQMTNGEWYCQIPAIQMYELRPSLLHEPGTAPPKQPGSLVIRQMDMESLYGSLSNTESLTAKGKLQFINPPKKNLANTIFAIPGEILTMLGLNLTVLNPVSGTIFYEIHDGKCYLTKFKDVYSEGKLSKFNLSDSREPSYVDFDGRLNLRIKMKQYNLFFKLAELFTVNVGGNLKKPTYSLNKHSANKDTANK